MLELDLFLLPFAEQQYDNLTEHEKSVFTELLTDKDPNLFAWLMGHQTVENKEFAPLVEKIRSFRRLCNNT
jgi:antitoxin CptB